MIQQLRRLRRNPILLARYVVHSPKTVALTLVGVVAVGLLSFTVALIPRWLRFLGVAALSGSVAVRQWGRLAIVVHAVSDRSDRMRGVDFDQVAADVVVMISKSPRRPDLIRSARSGMGPLGRHLGTSWLLAS